MAVNTVIMDYLKGAEGNWIHFNRGEADVTSAYGIYRHSFPKAEIFKWYEHIAQENNLSTNLQKSYKALKAIIEQDKKLQETERQMAWDFYEKNFMDTRINAVVSDKIEKTFFSLAVNGGMRRGYKAMQSALDKLYAPLVIDGKFGHHSMEALINYVTGTSYNEADFNDAMLAYMSDFYAMLIRKNPSKYARFKNGWNNRLKGLA